MPEMESVTYPASERPSRYPYFVLAMLLGIYLFSLIDRQILSVLIEPIKRDLLLSDTQIGLVSGLAFGLIYATAAIPLARLGDRKSRRGLIAICLAVWSIATGLCGAAQNFVQLFIARVAVGTGEAGASPSSQSLISDYFPPDRRATALGIYSMGIFIGSGLGLAIGGFLGEQFGWRTAFLLVAIPGILFALLFRLTVKEPVRGSMDHSDGSTKTKPKFLESFGVFFGNKALVATSIGLGFSVFTVQSLLNWLPSFLIRYHGMTPMEAGGGIGPIIAVAGTLGVFSGGFLADRLSRKDTRNSPRLMAIASFLVLPFGIGALTSDTQASFFMNLAVCFFLTAVVSGPTFALIQNLSPVSMRAMSAAMLGLVGVILGNALGPFLTGVNSDVFMHLGVADPLRWSLVVSVALNALGGIAYLIASKSMTQAGMDPSGS